jgi:hypothetical protein
VLANRKFIEWALRQKSILKNIAVERSERCNALHSLLMKLYPDANAGMGYKMPTYRFGDGWLAFANQKNYISES